MRSYFVGLLYMLFAGALFSACGLSENGANGIQFVLDDELETSSNLEDDSGTSNNGVTGTDPGPDDDADGLSNAEEALCGSDPCL